MQHRHTHARTETSAKYMVQLFFTFGISDAKVSVLQSVGKHRWCTEHSRSLDLFHLQKPKHLAKQYNILTGYCS